MNCSRKTSQAMVTAKRSGQKNTLPLPDSRLHNSFTPYLEKQFNAIMIPTFWGGRKIEGEGSSTKYHNSLRSYCPSFQPHFKMWKLPVTQQHIVFHPATNLQKHGLVLPVPTQSKTSFPSKLNGCCFNATI